MIDKELEIKAKEYADKTEFTEYANSSLPESLDISEDIKQAYIDGGKENQPTVEEMLKRLIKGGYVKSGIYEKKEKVIWHDLRKNPNDLPKENKLYLVFGYTNKREMFYELDVFEPTEEEFLGCGENVTAWCEIPKFEVEE